MATLDSEPEGDWLGRGARALDNPRTATGEESFDKLYRLRADLALFWGVRSQSFWDLKGKFCDGRILMPNRRHRPQLTSTFRF
ncbi:hypothetical protein Lal_00046512 [Lupinus albus]|nr:hypothetical protein Lal_00046518 [Lupinus albus]KAF1876982.1 hypothetical protein Lal_00046512 [Lupinus albus]